MSINVHGYEEDSVGMDVLYVCSMSGDVARSYPGSKRENK